MKVDYKILAVVAVLGLGAGLFWSRNFSKNNMAIVPTGSQPQATSNSASTGQDANVSTSANNQNIGAQDMNGFQPPLDRAGDRVTKKNFGIFITPQNSPVQPEKFSGYHTGADFEIFPEELNTVVEVHAVCTGKLAVKEYATGYGGVVVESCDLNGQPISVIYGHLRLASINLDTGADLKARDTIGVLGSAYSSETSGERKHLHLGFHKGISVNILGYVSNKVALSGWLNPCLWVCHN